MIISATATKDRTEISNVVHQTSLGEKPEPLWGTPFPTKYQDKQSAKIVH
jgi:hypothetical protein